MSSCRATPTIERADAGDGEQHAEHDRAVVGRRPRRATDRRDEIGVVVVEAALHLVEEALLLL